MDILGLLKNIKYAYGFCAACETSEGQECNPVCEIKFAIDSLESGRLVVVDRGFVKQAVSEITGVSLDTLLNNDQKQVFIEAIIRGQLANPPGEKR